MPRFWDGLSREVEDLLSVHATLPAEVHYLADIRHWILIQMAIALHFERQCDETRPPLSPKTLTAAIAATGIASRNTVRAFLNEMTRVQLTDHPPRAVQRQRAPQVSRKSERLMLTYIDIHLRALDTIDGGSRSGALRRRPEMLAYLQPCFAHRICLSPAWYDPPAEVRLFTNSASGSSVLHDLVLSARQRSADAEGRIWVGQVAAAQVAQRYQVSVAHVARMFGKARTLGAMGWARPGNRGDCWISEGLGRAYLSWQAEKLAALSAACPEAWARAGVSG